MTSPCLSLSNEPIFLFLEDKATFDYEKYRRKFSIIGIGQPENRGRKLQYSSDTKLWKISFPHALLYSLLFSVCGISRADTKRRDESLMGVHSFHR